MFPSSSLENKKPQVIVPTRLELCSGCSLRFMCSVVVGASSKRTKMHNRVVAAAGKMIFFADSAELLAGVLEQRQERGRKHL